MSLQSACLLAGTLSPPLSPSGSYPLLCHLCHCVSHGDLCGCLLLDFLLFPTPPGFIWSPTCVSILSRFCTTCLALLSHVSFKSSPMSFYCLPVAHCLPICPTCVPLLSASLSPAFVSSIIPLCHPLCLSVCLLFFPAFLPLGFKLCLWLCLPACL